MIFTDVGMLRDVVFEMSINMAYSRSILWLFRSYKSMIFIEFPKDVRSEFLLLDVEAI